MSYLCIKQYIYNTRCLKQIFVFLSITRKLKAMYNIDKKVAIRNKCLYPVQSNMEHLRRRTILILFCIMITLLHLNKT